MSTIKAVFFDLGDTLVERNPEVNEEFIKLIFAALGNSTPSDVDLPKLRQRLKATERAIWNSYKPKELLKIQTLEDEKSFLSKDFYPAVLKRWGLDNPPQVLLDELAVRQLGPTTFQCFPDVNDTLARLKGLGLILGCVSNALPSAEGILQHLELWDSFDCLMLSYRSDCRCLKPNRGIHRKAMNGLGVTSGEAIFIDDRPGFVNPARRVYAQAILLDRDGSHPDEKCPKIEHLGRLFPLLDQENLKAGPTGIPFGQLPLYGARIRTEFFMSDKSAILTRFWGIFNNDFFRFCARLVGRYVMPGLPRTSMKHVLPIVTRLITLHPRR